MNKLDKGKTFDTKKITKWEWATHRLSPYRAKSVRTCWTGLLDKQHLLVCLLLLLIMIKWWLSAFWWWRCCSTWSSSTLSLFPQPLANANKGIESINQRFKLLPFQVLFFKYLCVWFHFFFWFLQLENTRFINFKFGSPFFDNVGPCPSIWTSILNCPACFAFLSVSVCFCSI